jgi:hypothetical protein
LSTGSPPDHRYTKLQITALQSEPKTLSPH